VEFLVIWAAFAVGCYFVAKSKNRNAGAWAVAGLLFEVFALLVVALMPKKQVFQNPFYAQPGVYGAQGQYGQQPGYGVPQQYGVQPSYPQHQVPPPVGVTPAPYVVPPPVHPQYQSPQPASPSIGSEQQKVVGSVSIELARLGALHRSGQLSDADFEAAKRRLLGK